VVLVEVVVVEILPLVLVVLAVLDILMEKQEVLALAVLETTEAVEVQHSGRQAQLLQVVVEGVMVETMRVRLLQISLQWLLGQMV
jgi:hypothetical protein